MQISYNAIFIPFCYFKHTTILMPGVTPLKSDSIFSTGTGLPNDFFEAILYVSVSRVYRVPFLGYAFGIEDHGV